MGIPNHREVTTRWVNASAVHLHPLSFDFSRTCRQRLVPGEGSDSQGSELCKLEEPSALRASLASLSVLCPGKVNNPPPSLFLVSSLPFFASSLFDDLTAQVLLLMLAGINVNEVWVWLCSICVIKCVSKWKL